MKLIIAGITALFLVVFNLPPSRAAEGKSAIEIEVPWARASILKSRPGAAYLTIINHGTKPDRLLSVSSPMAEKVSIHLTEMTNGVMKMSPVDHLKIEPDTRVELKPGGLHLMLTNLRQALRKGETLTVTLTLEQAGRIEIKLPILGPGARGPK